MAPLLPRPGEATATLGAPPLPPRRRAALPDRRRAVRWTVLAGVVLAGQLAWLLAVSAHLWQRFSLTSDYALFFQAWHLIGHGQLSPTSTLYRTTPFLDNHLELFLYPLALYPWIWWSDAFDFHLEVFAALFALLAARSLWDRRYATAALWTVLTLSCGTVESVALVGIGIGIAISGRRLWRHGLGLAALALAYVLVCDALGFDKGSELATTYGYLAAAAPGTQLHATQVALGALRHPHLVLDMVNQKRRETWQALAGPGLVGVASALGLPVAAALLVPAVLNAQASVMQPEAAFQIFPVYLFVPVGGVLLVCWLARRARPFQLAMVVVGVAAVVQSVVLAVVWIPRAAPYFVRTSPQAAAVLARALAMTPPGAEVIASNGFVGRFAGRPWVYALEAPVGSGTVPVRAPVVELVLSFRQGLETTPLAHTRAAIAQVEHRLGARQVLDSAGIHVFLWHPGPSVRSVTLPGL